MYFDRFDIIEAHYLFCTEYHSGQWSKLYARMCRLSKIYSPCLSAQQGKLSSDNAEEIYRALVRAEKKRMRQAKSK